MDDSPHALDEWKALYIIEGSQSNPDVTEWDDPETIKRKLARKASASR